MQEAERTHAILSDYGLSLPKQVIASSENDVVKAANDIGYPVAMKIISESVAHKTDLGGVKLNLNKETEVRDSYKELGNIAYGLGGSGQVLVQQMITASPPVELIFGAKRDETFGCVILFGIGGVLAELNPDIAMCVEPWSDEDLRELFAKIKGHKLLEGFRGSKVVDMNALFNMAKNLGKLIQDNKEMMEIDLNPVVQSSFGKIVALDSKIMIADKSVPNLKNEGLAKADQIQSYVQPRNIAVIGASNDPNKIGGMVIPRLLKFGYEKEKIFPVNPSQVLISDLPCYKSIDAVPAKIDLACICTQASAVTAIIEQLGAKGAKSALIFSAGFSESGNATLQQMIRDKARQYGMRLLGPNSEGVVSSVYKTFASFSHRFDYLQSLQTGTVAIVSQSGGIMTNLALSLVESGASFSHVISVGNEADLDISDILNFFAQDLKTDVVGAFIEGIRDGGKFVQALKALKLADKPLIAYKAGKSNKGAKAAGLHTGALAGSYDVFRALVNQFGIVETDTLGEIGDILTALTFQPLPSGERLAVASASGGVNTIIADWCDKNSINLVEFSQEARRKLGNIMPELGSGVNPVDFPAQTMGSPTVIRDTLDILSDEADILLVVLIGGLGFAKAYADLCSSILLKKKPLITCWLSPRGVNEDARGALLERRMPTYCNPFEAVKVVQAMLWITKYRKRRL